MWKMTSKILFLAQGPVERRLRCRNLKPLRQDNKLCNEQGSTKRPLVLLFERPFQRGRYPARVHEPQPIHILPCQQALEYSVYRTALCKPSWPYVRLLGPIVYLVRHERFYSLAENMLLAEGCVVRSALHFETRWQPVDIFREVMVKERWPALNMMNQVDIVSDVAEEDIRETNLRPYVFRRVQRMPFASDQVEDPAVKAFCQCSLGRNIGAAVSPGCEW